MPFADSIPYQPPIYAVLAQLTPLYDFVLVKEVQSVKPGRASSLIIDPGNIRKTGDHRILVNRATGLREGVVIAAGRGDKAPEIRCVCKGAGHSWWQWKEAKGYTEIQDCPECGSGPNMNAIEVHHHRRHSMHVKPGDRVIYPRIPANDIKINGEDYTFCHEEQHILAVLED